MAVKPPKVPLPKIAQSLRFLVRPISFMEQWRRELGETFHASIIGPGEVVFISDPPSMKALFAADRTNTIAPGRNLILGPLLGSGSLLLQEDEEHLRRRKLMLPPFHGERMRAYEELIADVTRRNAERWPAGEPFSLHPHMQEITLEVILRAVFGIEDERRRDDLSAALVEILHATATPKAIGVVIPGVRDTPPYRHLRLLQERIDDLLADEISERRADPALDERDDILSMLVGARFEDGEPMSDKELRDQLMTLLLAGHETTATGLAWTFDLLFQNPEPYERLREEVAAQNGSEYTDAVAEEALRVRPVVPFTGRELRQDSHLGGYNLPSGSIVMASIYLAHTRPDVYADPFAFRPERFIEQKTDTYSWVPFGGGTRRCIGAAFAQLEMRVALRTILETWDLRGVDDGYERPVRRNVTMSPATGTLAVAERRN